MDGSVDETSIEKSDCHWKPSSCQYYLKQTDDWRTNPRVLKLRWLSNQKIKTTMDSSIKLHPVEGRLLHLMQRHPRNGPGSHPHWRWMTHTTTTMLVYEGPSWTRYTKLVPFSTYPFLIPRPTLYYTWLSWCLFRPGIHPFRLHYIIKPDFLFKMMASPFVPRALYYHLAAYCSRFAPLVRRHSYYGIRGVNLHNPAGDCTTRLAVWTRLVFLSCHTSIKRDVHFSWLGLCKFAPQDDHNCCLHWGEHLGVTLRKDFDCKISIAFLSA